DGLDQRVVAAPLPPAGYSDLQAGSEGHVFFLKSRELGIDDEDMTGSELRCFDVTKRKGEKVMDRVADYRLTPDGTKVRAPPRGKGPDDPATWTITELAAMGERRGSSPPSGGQGGGGDSHGSPGKKLNLDAVEVRVDPPAEWAQILDEV